jgi:hypothetical protein
MTEQEKLRRDIYKLKAMIQFDLRELDQSSLTADERLTIKDHLDTLISHLQPLLPRVPKGSHPTRRSWEW